MKKYILSIIAMAFGMLSAIAQTVSVEDVTIKAGETKMVSINLNNSQTNIMSFQMDLTLPEGITINKAGCSLGSRITDPNQGLTIGKQSDGSIRLTSISFAFASVSGTSGEIIKLSLTAANDAKGGTAVLKNIVLATSSSQKLKPANVAFNVNVAYTLTYLIDGEVYKTFSMVYGTAITPESVPPTKEGYSFSGWSEIPATMPNYDVEISGTFSINSYSFTYLVDGEVYKTLTVDYGTTIIPEAEPTKEGHTFSGWSEIPETMPAHDVEVTGSFSVNSYTLIYKLDGIDYMTLSVEYGTALTPLAAPVRKGMTFSGWGEVPETMPAHDVTLSGSYNWLEETINDVTYQVSDTLNNYASVIGIGGTSEEVTILPAVLIDGEVYAVSSIAEDVLPQTATVYTSFSKILFWLWTNGYEDIREIESGRVLSAPEPTLVATNASSLRLSYTNEYPELGETVMASGTPVEKGENGYPKFRSTLV